MVVTSKWLPLDARIELVTPAKPARLSGAAGNSTGYQAPIPGTELSDELTENCVFFRGPGTPDAGGAPTGPSVTVGARIVGSDGVVIVNEVGRCHWGEVMWCSAGNMNQPNGKTEHALFTFCPNVSESLSSTMFRPNSSERRRLEDQSHLPFSDTKF